MASLRFHSLILAMALTICSSSVDSVTLYQFQVFIINNLGDDMTLTLHCQSNAGEDLGIETLPFGASFNFTVDIVVGKTALYSCGMNSGNLHGLFDVFETKRDFGRCDHFKCLWRVDRDGLYLYIKDIGDYVLQYRWS